jgi:hypothetical protein
MLGWAMKHFRWPRPPLILGVVLGGILERYMFISIQRYGVSWMMRPLVMVMFALSILTLTRPVLQDIREHHGIKAMLSNFGAPRLTTDNLFPAALLCIFTVMLAQATHWGFEARIIPTIVGTVALITCGVSLANDIFSKAEGEVVGLADKAKAVVSQKIHMDIASKTSHLPGDVILIRGFIFFGWMVAFLGSMATIGLLPTVPLFVIAYMRLEGGEKYRHCIIMAGIMVTLIYGVFDQLLALPWPPTYLGDWLPAFKMVPSV